MPRPPFRTTMHLLGSVLLLGATTAVAAALLLTAVRALRRTGRPGWTGFSSHNPAEVRYLVLALGGLLIGLFVTDQALRDRLLPAFLAWFGASAAHYVLGPRTPGARTATSSMLGALALATAALG